MATLPYLPLYTGDWMKDPKLSRCSPATRGIWMDLLCAMHNDSQSGQISGTVEQLARVARCSPDELQTALAELRQTGTAEIDVQPERDKSVTCHVINRRMSRESHARERARKRKENQRIRDTEAKCHAPVTPPSQDMSVSLSFSCSEETSFSSCSSSADGQQQQPDWPSVIQDRQSKNPGKNVQHSWEKFMAMPGEKTVPGFDKWLAREWPAPKVSPIRPGMQVGAPSKTPTAVIVSQQDMADLAEFFESMPNHQAEAAQLREQLRGAA